MTVSRCHFCKKVGISEFDMWLNWDVDDLVCGKCWRSSPKPQRFRKRPYLKTPPSIDLNSDLKSQLASPDPIQYKTPRSSYDGDHHLRERRSSISSYHSTTTYYKTDSKNDDTVKQNDIGEHNEGASSCYSSTCSNGRDSWISSSNDWSKSPTKDWKVSPHCSPNWKPKEWNSSPNRKIGNITSTTSNNWSSPPAQWSRGSTSSSEKWSGGSSEDWRRDWSVASPIIPNPQGNGLLMDPNSSSLSYTYLRDLYPTEWTFPLSKEMTTDLEITVGSAMVDNSVTQKRTMTQNEDSNTKKDSTNTDGSTAKLLTDKNFRQNESDSVAKPILTIPNDCLWPDTYPVLKKQVSLGNYWELDPADQVGKRTCAEWYLKEERFTRLQPKSHGKMKILKPSSSEKILKPSEKLELANFTKIPKAVATDVVMATDAAVATPSKPSDVILSTLPKFTQAPKDTRKEEVALAAANDGVSRDTSNESTSKADTTPPKAEATNVVLDAKAEATPTTDTPKYTPKVIDTPAKSKRAMRSDADREKSRQHVEWLLEDIPTSRALRELVWKTPPKEFIEGWVRRKKNGLQVEHLGKISMKDNIPEDNLDSLTEASLRDSLKSVPNDLADEFLSAMLFELARSVYYEKIFWDWSKKVADIYLEEYNASAKKGHCTYFLDPATGCENGNACGYRHCDNEKRRRQFRTNLCTHADKVFCNYGLKGLNFLQKNPQKSHISPKKSVVHTPDLPASVSTAIISPSKSSEDSIFYHDDYCPYGVECGFARTWDELRSDFRGSRDRWLNFYYGPALYRLEWIQLIKDSKDVKNSRYYGCLDGFWRDLNPIEMTNLTISLGASSLLPLNPTGVSPKKVLLPIVDKQKKDKAISDINEKEKDKTTSDINEKEKDKTTSDINERLGAIYNKTISLVSAHDIQHVDHVAKATQDLDHTSSSNSMRSTTASTTVHSISGIGTPEQTSITKETTSLRAAEDFSIASWGPTLLKSPSPLLPELKKNDMDLKDSGAVSRGDAERTGAVLNGELHRGAETSETEVSGIVVKAENDVPKSTDIVTAKAKKDEKDTATNAMVEATKAEKGAKKTPKTLPGFYLFNLKSPSTICESLEVECIDVEELDAHLSADGLFNDYIAHEWIKCGCCEASVLRENADTTRDRDRLVMSRISNACSSPNQMSNFESNYSSSPRSATNAATPMGSPVGSPKQVASRSSSKLPSPNQSTSSSTTGSVIGSPLESGTLNTSFESSPIQENPSHESGKDSLKENGGWGGDWMVKENNLDVNPKTHRRRIGYEWADNTFEDAMAINTPFWSEFYEYSPNAQALSSPRSLKRARKVVERVIRGLCRKAKEKQKKFLQRRTNCKPVEATTGAKLDCKSDSVDSRNETTELASLLELFTTLSNEENAGPVLLRKASVASSGIDRMDSNFSDRSTTSTVFDTPFSISSKSDGTVFRLSKRAANALDALGWNLYYEEYIRDPHMQPIIQLHRGLHPAVAKSRTTDNSARNTDSESVLKTVPMSSWLREMCRNTVWETFGGEGRYTKGLTHPNQSSVADVKRELFPAENQEERVENKKERTEMEATKRASKEMEATIAERASKDKKAELSLMNDIAELNLSRKTASKIAQYRNECETFSTYSREKIARVMDRVFRRFYDDPSSRLMALERMFIVPTNDMLSHKRRLHFQEWPITRRLVFDIYIHEEEYKNSEITFDIYFHDKPEDELTMIDSHTHMDIIMRKLPFRLCDTMQDRLLLLFHPDSPYALPNGCYSKTITSICDEASLNFFECYAEELYGYNINKEYAIKNGKINDKMNDKNDGNKNRNDYDYDTNTKEEIFFDDDNMYFSVGWHPKSFNHYVKNYDNMRNRMYNLADFLQSKGKLVGWGEIGLDYDMQTVENPNFDTDFLHPNLDMEDENTKNQYKKVIMWGSVENNNSENSSSGRNSSTSTSSIVEISKKERNPSSLLSMNVYDHYEDWPSNVYNMNVKRLPQAWRPVQQEMFIENIKEGLRRKLPLVIHSRGADRDMWLILKKYVPPEWGLHMHCWSSSRLLVQKLTDYYPNCKIGIGGHYTAPAASKWTVYPEDRIEATSAHYLANGSTHYHWKFLEKLDKEKDKILLDKIDGETAAKTESKVLNQIYPSIGSWQDTSAKNYKPLLAEEARLALGGSDKMDLAYQVLNKVESVISEDEKFMRSPENLIATLHQVVKWQNIVVETDAPYMQPIMSRDSSLSYEMPNLSALPSQCMALLRFLYEEKGKADNQQVIRGKDGKTSIRTSNEKDLRSPIKCAREDMISIYDVIRVIRKNTKDLYGI